MSSYPNYIDEDDEIYREEELDLALGMLNISKSEFKKLSFDELNKLYTNINNTYRKNLALKVLLKNKKKTNVINYSNI